MVLVGMIINFTGCTIMFTHLREAIISVGVGERQAMVQAMHPLVIFITVSIL